MKIKTVKQKKNKPKTARQGKAKQKAYRNTIELAFDWPSTPGHEKGSEVGLIHLMSLHKRKLIFPFARRYPYQLAFWFGEVGYFLYLVWSYWISFLPLPFLLPLIKYSLGA